MFASKSMIDFEQYLRKFKIVICSRMSREDVSNSQWCHESGNCRMHHEGNNSTLYAPSAILRLLTHFQTVTRRDLFQNTRGLKHLSMTAT